MARLTSNQVQDGRTAWLEIQNRIVEKLNRPQDDKQSPGLRPEGAEEITLVSTARIAASDDALLDDLLIVANNSPRYLPDKGPLKFYSLNSCFKPDEHALDRVEPWMKRIRDKKQDVWTSSYVAWSIQRFRETAEWFDQLMREVKTEAACLGRGEEGKNPGLYLGEWQSQEGSAVRRSASDHDRQRGQAG